MLGALRTDAKWARFACTWPQAPASDSESAPGNLHIRNVVHERRECFAFYVETLAAEMCVLLGASAEVGSHSS